MKKSILFTLVLLLFGSVSLQAQSVLGANTFPDNIKVKDLSGNVVSSGDFDNDGKPIIVSFFATWCKPCILELNTVAEQYEDWADETGVKLIAISVDDARNSHKVPVLVNGKGWEYEVYIDENQDLKRALGVGNIPHTFILDANKKIVYNHNGYTPGDEEELYDHVIEVAEGHE